MICKSVNFQLFFKIRMSQATSNPPHVIPNMTHPLSRAWDQPSREKILVDDNSAVMENATFEQLKNYSTSIPSGVYEGKMWRRLIGIDWYLCWYYPGDRPSTCAVDKRKIIISDKDSFEVGKCYEHTSGQQLHIIGKASTVLHGHCLMAETGWNRDKLAEREELAIEKKEKLGVDITNHAYCPIVNLPGAATNYKRITLQEFITNNFPD